MNKALVLVGPTASGKTAVACELARRFPAELISCDSMQVYRGMPITTQAPSKKEQKILKMHLVSFLSVSKEYNAALFQKDGRAWMKKIAAKKKTPMIVGGTGLYVRALLDGLFENERDRMDEKLRRRLAQAEERHGAGHLHGRLRDVDATAAARIHPNDLRRLIRALEIFHLTGQSMSSQEKNRHGIRAEWDCRTFLLDRDRTDLYERIDRRVHQMIKEGLVEEVEKIRKKKPGKTAGMALGLREIGADLDGRCKLEEAVEELKKNTRRYAKRQLSWFRHEKEICVVPVSKEETAKATANKIWRLWKEARA